MNNNYDDNDNMAEDSFSESELGHVRFQQGRRRTITVEDPTYEKEEIHPEQVAVMRKERQMVSEGAKKRAEILIGLGRATEDVRIDNITFSIRTLQQKEQRDVIKAVSSLDLASEMGYELRVRTLAHAIYAVDGKHVDLVLGTSDVAEKAEIINNMDETIVSYLYKKYTELNNKNKVKYNLTEEEAGEVAEDIKK